MKEQAFARMLMAAIQEVQPPVRARTGRTAILPTPPTVAAAEAVLARHSIAHVPLEPCGTEVRGLDLAASDGIIELDVAGALEVLMAHLGFVLFRKQGRPQRESGVAGTYLTAEQQCNLSMAFGAGELHSCVPSCGS